MTWWTQTEYSYDKNINIETLKTDIWKIKDEFNIKNDSIINWISIYNVSWEKSL